MPIALFHPGKLCSKQWMMPTTKKGQDMSEFTFNTRLGGLLLRSLWVKVSSDWLKGLEQYRDTHTDTHPTQKANTQMYMHTYMHTQLDYAWTNTYKIAITNKSQVWVSIAHKHSHEYLTSCSVHHKNFTMHPAGEVSLSAWPICIL